MKQLKLAFLMSALLSGVAFGTAAAADERAALALPASASGVVLAKHGADDPLPQPCDDNGTDVCVNGGQLVAKHGADDAQPEPCDDHGTDICFIKA